MAEPEVAQAKRLDRLLQLSDRHWLAATVLSAFAMGVIWIVARLIATVGLAMSGTAACVVSAVVLAGLAGLALAAAVIGPWRARARHGAPPWEVASFVLSIASLGLFVEAMAAVTAATWRVSGETVSAWGGLWRAEQFYLHQLVGSIPLLDLPSTLGWEVPAYGVAHTPPGLQLTFKIIVIAPLLRIAVEGYRMIVDRATHATTVEWIAWNKHDRHFERLAAARGSADRLTPRTMAVLLFAGFIVKAVLIGGAWYLALAQAYTPGSWLNRQWLAALEAMQVDVAWLHPVPQVVLLIASWWVFALLISPLEETKTETRWRFATPIAQTLTGVYCAMLFLSGVFILLRELGVNGPALGSRPWDSVMETLAWHLVRVLPGPDIAGTLHWTPPMAIAGSWLGWFAVLPQMILLGSVVIVWLPGIRMGTVRQRYGPVLEFWYAARTVDWRGSADVADRLAALARRREFAALMPAAERLRAAASGPAEEKEAASREFLSVVDAEAPECGQSLRTMLKAIDD